MLQRLLPAVCSLRHLASAAACPLPYSGAQACYAVKASLWCRALSLSPISLHTCHQRHAHSQQTWKHLEEEKAEEYLSNLKADEAKKLKILQLEVDMLQHMGALVPDNFRSSWWVNLLNLETPSARRKYCKYLRIIEKNKLSKEQKKREKAQRREEREREKERDRIVPKEPKNTIFMYVYTSTMHNYYNSRLAHAMIHGPELIVDMDYDSVMQRRECTNLAEQLMMASSFNRRDVEPFHMVFTGVSENNRTLQFISRQENSMGHSLFTITDQSYLDLYPRDKLVYLTPNAPEDLTEFNYDDVYVIGGLVDRANCKPLSMAKAKQQNIRMAKFPLDKFLLWCKGGKSLTIDQVFRILLDLKSTKSWEQALSHVPRRKVLELPVNENGH